MARSTGLVADTGTSKNEVRNDITEMIAKLSEQKTLGLVESMKQNNVLREWNSRLIVGMNLIHLAPDEKAVEHVRKLTQQAVVIVEDLKVKANAQDERMENISDHLVKLEGKLREIDNLEKASVLDKRLRMISTKAYTPEVEVMDTTQRDVKLLLHTAQALIELQTDKA